MKKMNKSLFLLIERTMDTTPLGMQFSEFDTDHDGKITAQQAYELLKLLGRNLYQGTVTNVMRMMNCDQQNPQHFTFDQFREYFQSYESTPKHDIWKLKYEILQGIQQIKRPLKQMDKSQDTAAPGSNAELQHPNELTQGNIQVTVGSTNATYNSLIDLSIFKESKPETKPFVKITFQQSSVDRATKLEQLIKGLHQTAINMVKQMEPEYGVFLADQFKIITNVVDCRLNVFIKTQRQDLIEVGLLLARALDMISNSQNQVKLSFKQRFSIDVNKFLQAGSDYTFHNALTKDASTSISWKAMHPKQSWKALLRANEAFNDLKYDPADPYCLFLIGLLHVTTINCSFVFDNVQFQTFELQSKNEVLQGLSQLHNMIKETQEESQLKIKDLIAAIDDKIQIDVSIGDWKATARIQMPNLNQIFLKQVN